jgi:transposase-like protein
MLRLRKGHSKWLPPLVPQAAVSLHLWRGAALRQTETALLARGLAVDHVTLRRWISAHAGGLHPPEPGPWRAECVALSLAEGTCYFWVACAPNGALLDLLVQQRMNPRKAELRLARNLAERPVGRQPSADPESATKTGAPPPALKRVAPS